MATISTLAVNLIARTSVFEKGMKRSRNATKSLKSTITGAVGSIARFAKGLAIAAGIGGMGFLLKSTLSTLDAVSKLSRRLGIAHEALLGLRHAGELAGISIQAMDKALETFTRRMGEVKAGSGEAKRGLEALGLSAERMIAMTPDKALLVIADRIETLGTQAEKAAAAYFLFGRAGAQMLNLFEQGAAGIEKAQKQAKELGITLEGYDLTQIEAANDVVLSLKKSFTSLFQVITIKIAPTLERLAVIMTKNREAIVSVIGKFAIFVASAVAIATAIKVVAVAIAFLTHKYTILIAKQIVMLAMGGPAGWGALAIGIGVATVAIVTVNEALDATVGKFKELGTVATQVDTQSGVRLKMSAQQLRFKQLEINKERELLAIKQQEKAAFSSIDAFISNLQNQIGGIGIDPLFAQLNKMEELGDALTGEAWVEWNKGMQDAANLIDELISKREDLEAEKETPDTPGSIKGGRFQEIRSEFIDVAALNAGGSVHGVNRTNALLSESISIQQRTLTEIKGNDLL
jgi:hypothetical protein